MTLKLDETGRAWARLRQRNYEPERMSRSSRAETLRALDAGEWPRVRYRFGESFAVNGWYHDIVAACAARQQRKDIAAQNAQE